MLVVLGERDLLRVAVPAAHSAKEPSDDSAPHGIDKSGVCATWALHAEHTAWTNLFVQVKTTVNQNVDEL